MKKGLYFLLSFSVLVFVYSCQKGTNLTTGADGDPGGALANHGTGAILDQEAFKKIPQIDFDAVQQHLIGHGFGKIVASANATTLPSSIILNHPPVGDQGQTGTCVSWSVGWAIAGTLNNEFPKAGVSNPRSPWYIYQKDHSAMGDCSPNDGMYVPAGLDILKANGVPAYSLDPVLGSPCQAPTAVQNNSAVTDRVLNYAALHTVNDVKKALSLHLPVEMGLNLCNSFYKAFNNGTIFKQITGANHGGNSGHAICIIGYDDSKNAVLIQNSWGTQGGDPAHPGCMWMDYSTLTDPRLSIELYSVWK